MKHSALLLASAALAACVSPLQAQEAFFDTFDRLDQSRWYISDGWSNGAHQNCTWSADQVTVANSALRVGFAPKPKVDRQYRCGEIQTRKAYGYGTYEARLKTPKGSGLNAAFFTYIGPQQGQPHDEIDFEVLLKDTSHVDTTTFVNGKSGDGKVGSGQSLELPRPADSDFITYAFTWEPDRLRFYIDGKLARTMDNPATIPSHDQRIFFSLWGSDTLTEWMGPFTPVTEPIAMNVDWVAFTPLGQACTFEQSIVCQQSGDE
ncbi:family 16 glycosylhydrolase [Devosia oryzisoli]|uniref:endo-1,3-1,4-beta-glycanase ExoK n=1 Tax=Devosia oryzisoli TaxID=2774138 RepID=UPI0031F4D27B